MSTFQLLGGLSLLFATMPAMVFLTNLFYYRKLPLQRERSRPFVSVVIPARNEAANVFDVLRSVLASEGVPMEVIVVDDHSDDETANLVQGIALSDARVRLVRAPPLPKGWCGKQHACQVGADHSLHEMILFLDADVRLRPCALARMIDRLEETSVDLLSGFPRQLTSSWLEKMVIPLIHFVLLGFLPLSRMRWKTKPCYAAGCGQLFLVRRAAYEQTGGHKAIKASLMDGIALPRAMRQKGLRADLTNAMQFAECRMYYSAREVWMGLSKNATEGLAAPNRIVPFTLILFGGQVLPFVLLACTPLHDRHTVLIPLIAVALAYLPRIIGTICFRESPLGAAFHPVGITILLAIQWFALIRFCMGLPATWRGRTYASSLESEKCRDARV